MPWLAKEMNKHHSNLEHSPPHLLALCTSLQCSLSATLSPGSDPLGRFYIISIPLNDETVKTVTYRDQRTGQTGEGFLTHNFSSLASYSNNKNEASCVLRCERDANLGFMFSTKPCHCSGPEYGRGWVFLCSCCHLKETSKTCSEVFWGKHVYISRLGWTLSWRRMHLEKQYYKQNIYVSRNRFLCPGRYPV